MQTSKLLLLNLPALKNFYYHSFWGLCYGKNNNITSLGQQLISNQHLLSEIQSKQKIIEGYHPIIRFFYWLFNIDNYTQNAYLLLAHESYEAYKNYRNEYLQEENRIVTPEFILKNGTNYTHETAQSVLKNWRDWFNFKPQAIEKDNASSFQEQPTHSPQMFEGNTLIPFDSSVSQKHSNDENPTKSFIETCFDACIDFFSFNTPLKKSTSQEQQRSSSSINTNLNNEDTSENRSCIVCNAIQPLLEYMNIKKENGEQVCWQEIMSAYRKKALQTHPDRRTGSKEAFEYLIKCKDELEDTLFPDRGHRNIIAMYEDLINILREQNELLRQGLKKINQALDKLIYKEQLIFARIEKLEKSFEESYRKNLMKNIPLSDKRNLTTATMHKGCYPIYRSLSIFSSKAVNETKANQGAADSSLALVKYGFH